MKQLLVHNIEKYCTPGLETCTADNHMDHCKYGDNFSEERYVKTLCGLYLYHELMWWEPDCFARYSQDPATFEREPDIVFCENCLKHPRTQLELLALQKIG